MKKGTILTNNLTNIGIEYHIDKIKIATNISLVKEW
jgi:hypothetical protein